MTYVVCALCQRRMGPFVKPTYRRFCTPCRRKKKCTGARLTIEQVRRLREMRKAGTRLLDVAKTFGVSLSTVSKIANGQRWADV